MFRWNCWMKNSTAYAKNEKMTPEGIVVHSSGMNHPYLGYYVQPCSFDENYDQLITIIGKNSKNNDYNHTHRNYNFHYWIGKRSDIKQTITLATIPFNMRTWNDNYIHICICEDNLKDKNYLTECLRELVDICYVLCDFYDWEIDKIYDYSDLTDHPDANYWFQMHGYSIDTVREAVRRMPNIRMFN